MKNIWLSYILGSYCYTVPNNTYYSTNHITIHLDRNAPAPGSATFSSRQRKIYKRLSGAAATAEMDRPSVSAGISIFGSAGADKSLFLQYHTHPDDLMHIAAGSLSNLFDTETGRAYRATLDEANPEVLLFQHTGGARKPSPLLFAMNDDPTPLAEVSGTQMARVQVAADWDKSKYYDLTSKTGGLEFVYETPSQVPFQILQRGILRGTALVRLGNTSFTMVSKSIAYLCVAHTLTTNCRPHTPPQRSPTLPRTCLSHLRVRPSLPTSIIVLLAPLTQHALRFCSPAKARNSVVGTCSSLKYIYERLMVYRLLKSYLYYAVRRRSPP